MKAVYFDCSATTPIDPRVAVEMQALCDPIYGNPSAYGHDHSHRAARVVHRAREQTAELADAAASDVVFTSGTTESNNIAIAGLAAHGSMKGRRHIVSTAIEHKSVLEPLIEMRNQGFEVQLVPPTKSGRVRAEDVLSAARSDTLLVSVMHANNETGVLQPIADIADGLKTHDAFLHVDAAQSFARGYDALRHRRLDLLSVSGHKIYGPKGVGALIVRGLAEGRIPLRPLVRGGGQESGIRPGTVPVPLVGGLGRALQIASEEHGVRAERCLKIRERVLGALEPLAPKPIGDATQCLPHVVNVAFPGVDGHQAVAALREWISISHGAACDANSPLPSHVLVAMGCDACTIDGALRFSWYHDTPEADWDAVLSVLRDLA